MLIYVSIIYCFFNKLQICANQFLPLTQTTCMREYSSMHTGPMPQVDPIDPYVLLEDDLKYVMGDIRQVSVIIFHPNR